MGELAGGLTHEINNMLSVINGYCCLLQMEEAGNDRARTHVERILATTARAAELTGSLLVFAGKRVVDFRSQDLNRIVRAVDALAATLVPKSIKLRTALSAGSLFVRADSGHMMLLLVNLITMARDALPGGGLLEISTSSRHLGSAFIAEHGQGDAGLYAVLAVCDNGTGMDDAAGPGLPTVRGIVMRHGGFIVFTSEAGRGSAIEVFLPIVEAPGT